jgi:DNA-binding transcriptional LysR family regulator
MKLNQIQLFVETADSGSIANAARRLGKSRSAVSSAIATLEVELGVELFERGANQSRLTDIGEQVLDDCRRLLQAANSLKLKCEHHASGAEVALRVARDDAIPEVVWREMLGALRRQFPGTSISLVLASPPELPALVEEGFVDAAFGLITEEQERSGLCIDVLNPIRTLMVVAPSHPLAGLKRVLQQDLTDHTQVTLSYVDAFSVKSLLPIGGQHIGLSSFELMRDAVLDGLGWAVLPSPLIQSQLRQGELLTLKHKFSLQWRDYGVYLSENAHHGKVLAWLKKAIEAYLEPFE